MIGFIDFVLLAVTVLVLYFIIKLAIKNAINELKKDGTL